MLTAFYDLHVSPPTFDIVAFLMVAERYRIERGASEVRIEILPGPAGGFRQDRLWPHSIPERQMMLERVAVPMARMLPSAADVIVRRDRPQRRECPAGSIGFMSPLFGLSIQVQMMRAGIRPLRASAALPRNPRLVTITLREAEHWPGRNSNVEAWQRAALALVRRGFRVVVLRDTRHASEPLAGLEADATASCDLQWRATLYRMAACNMGVNNGPLWFAMALDAPVLMLKPVTEQVQRACSADYFAACGIPFGGQIPGAPPYQRLVWADDTEDNILAAFELFMTGHGNGGSEDRAA